MPPCKPRRSPVPSAILIEQSALRYLARRDRTEAQMRAYLSRGGASSAQIQNVISRLRERGYLNDEAYALRWAQARLARRPVGRDRLEAELLGQGVDRVIAARAVEQVYRELSECALARTLLEQRLGVGNSWSRSRGESLLRRHGFSEETIEETLERVRPV
ncbi:MAG: RecX family transcriptional regulator [Nitrospirae bacterium]|nr:RecX family transcriptional regulator [Nitrospirota bacterium]